MSTDTEAKYRRVDAVNWSSLKALAESPAHYRAALLDPPPDSDTFATGRALHCLVLEPMAFASQFVVWPESAGARRGKEWVAFKEAAEASDQTILRESDYESVRRMADAVRSYRPFADLVARGEQPAVEHPLMWTDAATGLPCKGRVDYYDRASNVLLDVKTAMTVEARRFGSVAARLLYHGQMAHYAAGIEAAFGQRPDCYLVAVEKAEPHDCAVYQLLPDDLALGDAVRRDLLTKLVQCRASLTWPGRYDEIQPLRLPAWAWSDEAASAEDHDPDAGMVPADL